MKNWLPFLRSFWFISSGIFCSIPLYGYSPPVGPDTCTVNDDCQQAIFVPNIISDHAFVCTQGCNLYASPDAPISTCQMGDFPTVWYRMNTDAITKVINIEVHSADFEAPVLAVFKSINGCENLEQVYLTNGNLACIIGTDGFAKAIGTPVSPLTNYYIAVSSHNSIGGDFEICISALSTGSTCVLSRDIQITARSNGGPLEGPFVPGETVSVCMNINEYTAAANGCQWFQGIVPVFGRGWDPSSFDLNGQPLDTRLNNTIIGQANNGLYGAAT